MLRNVINVISSMAEKARPSCTTGTQPGRTTSRPTRLTCCWIWSKRSSCADSSQTWNHGAQSVYTAGALSPLLMFAVLNMHNIFAFVLVQPGSSVLSDKQVSFDNLWLTRLDTLTEPFYFLGTFLLSPSPPFPHTTKCVMQANYGINLLWNKLDLSQQFVGYK